VLNANECQQTTTNNINKHQWKHQGTQTSIDKAARSANMHLGTLTSTNKTPKNTNQHQPSAVQKPPTKTNIAQQGASMSINRPQQRVMMNTTKSQQQAPAKHG
jgi:hypothetical protein